MDVVHFHLMILHFPIALLIVGAVLQLTAVVTGTSAIRSAARISIVLGTSCAIATAWSGDAAEEVLEKSLRVPEGVLERHEELGMWTAYVAAALLVAELATIRVRSLAFDWGVTGLAITVAILVGLAGFSGGKIRHDEAARNGAGAAPFVPIPRPEVETGD